MARTAPVPGSTDTRAVCSFFFPDGRTVSTALIAASCFL